jgi:hypothetical protein
MIGRMYSGYGAVSPKTGRAKNRRLVAALTEVRARIYTSTALERRSDWHDDAPLAIGFVFLYLS